jgi:TANFOR domain-containing protein
MEKKKHILSKLIKRTKGLFTLRFILCTSLFALAFLPEVALAQFDVSASIRLIPPYPVRLSDYADNPQNTIITLRNHTNRPINLYLAGGITGENGIEIRTAANRRGSSMIQLDPLEIKNLNGEAMRDIFDINLLQINGISRDAMVRGNGLPEGIYTICIRAYDYQTMELLSAEEPLGCSNPINLTNLEPPIFLKPFADNDTIPGMVPQNLIFTWSFPAGAPPTTEYTFTMIEMLDPRRNPNDAILSATTPPFYEDVVSSNAMLFGPAHPTLVSGRKYAIAVTARDPFNKVVFRNNGRSEVLSFVYWDGTGANFGDLPISQTRMRQASASCACKFTVPKGQTDNNRVTEGSIVKAGNFDMTVTKILSSGNSLSGEGKILLDNLKGIAVSVSFADMQVNAQNQMKSGIIRGITKNSASFFPTSAGANQRTLEFSKEMAQQVDSYFIQNPQQLISKIIPGISQPGTEFPIGIENTVGGQRHVLTISNFEITPEQASFDAAMVMDLAGTGSRAIFSAKGICMDNSSFCGQTNLYLSEDLDIPISKIKLLGTKANLVSPLDSGTYITVSAAGFEKMRIQGVYEFPTHLLTNKNNPGTPVTARLFANTISWSDWMAQALIDPFQINGHNDFTFSLKPGINAIYDHSSLRNPNNMPQIAEKTNHLSLDWTGFYFPEMLVELPEAIKKINSKERVTVSSNSMILDRMGLSGKISANNILSLSEGDLLGWYYSLEQIQAEFINNSFATSNMKGKLVLPISGSQYANPQAQLNYTCTMSKPSGAMKYQFQVERKDNMAAPLWSAQMGILPSSNIEIALGTANDFAKANLNGSMTIKGDLAKLSEVVLAGMPFEGLSIQNLAPFITVNNFRTGLSGTVKSVGGFPVSLKAPELFVRSSQIGLRLGIDLELGDIATLPKASSTIELLGKTRTLSNGRPDWGWEAPDVVVSKIGVSGPVGPVSIKGEIEFFDKDNEYGNGLRGEVSAKMIGGLEIGGNALFGRKGFSYWYVDARLQLPPPGITLAPPLPLSAFGFGGGAYYNMSQRPLPTPLQVFEGNFQKTNLYVPASGTVGFKASIILGISDGQLYQAEGGLTAELNHRTMAVNEDKN